MVKTVGRGGKGVRDQRSEKTKKQASRKESKKKKVVNALVHGLYESRREKASWKKKFGWVLGGVKKMNWEAGDGQYTYGEHLRTVETIGPLQ